MQLLNSWHFLFITMLKHYILKPETFFSPFMFQRLVNIWGYSLGTCLKTQWNNLKTDCKDYPFTMNLQSNKQWNRSTRERKMIQKFKIDSKGDYVDTKSRVSIIKSRIYILFSLRRVGGDRKTWFYLLDQIHLLLEPFLSLLFSLS